MPAPRTTRRPEYRRGCHHCNRVAHHHRNHRAAPLHRAAPRRRVAQRTVHSYNRFGHLTTNQPSVVRLRYTLRAPRAVSGAAAAAATVILCHSPPPRSLRCSAQPRPPRRAPPHDTHAPHARFYRGTSPSRAAPGAAAAAPATHVSLTTTTTTALLRSIAPRRRAAQHTVHNRLCEQGVFFVNQAVV